MLVGTMSLLSDATSSDLDNAGVSSPSSRTTDGLAENDPWDFWDVHPTNSTRRLGRLASVRHQNSTPARKRYPIFSRRDPGGVLLDPRQNGIRSSLDRSVPISAGIAARISLHKDPYIEFSEGRSRRKARQSVFSRIAKAFRKN